VSGRRAGEAASALSYAVRHGGGAPGQPFPFRASGSMPWKKDVHTGLRLTEAGFGAAGAPRRAGRASLAFGDPETSGWTLTMIVGAGGVRVALVPMPPSPYGRSSVPVAFPAPSAARPTVEEHADPADGAQAMRRLAARAEALAGAPARVVDPGYVAWDGEMQAWEDAEAIDAGRGPGADEVLAMVEDVLAPSPARRP
jgi:hypothetical protein